MQYFELEVSDGDKSTLQEIEKFSPLAITLLDAKDEPILEPMPGTTPLWQNLNIKALFASLDEALIVKAMLDKTAIVRKIADKNWVAETQKLNKPQFFGNNLWVCPSDQRTIILNPGLAFGTGNHATTHLCLEWISQMTLEKLNCLDFGCGSGILAIAAAKCGAKEVYALDIDPQAEIATASNVKLNNLDNIFIKEPLSNTQDIIFANILLQPLIELKTKFIKYLKADGKIVVSGLLKGQDKQLIDAYTPEFKLITYKFLEDWALVELQLY